MKVAMKSNTPKLKLVWLLAMPALVQAPALAADPAADPAADCARVSDRTARLACFDALFGEEANSLLTEAMPAVTPKPQSSSKEDQETMQQATRNRQRGFFERREKIDFAGTIKAVRARDKQRMMFLLENGEVWLQTSPRTLPIKKGEEITIKSGLIGGFMLRTNAGVGTRVSRIK